MLTEAALEILHFFSRLELEGLQMHSRFLRDFVDRNSDTLPLRPIHIVKAFGRGGVDVLLERGNVNDDSRFKLSTRTQSSLELLLHGVNNAFIERLAISFLREPNWVADGVRFVAYLQDHAAALKCHIRVLSVVDFDGTPAHISLIGYVASRFKPQALDIDVNFDDAEGPLTMLFDHASIRSSFKHVTFNDDFGVLLGANCLVPALLNVGSLQTCFISTSDDAEDWIIRFKNLFEATTRGAKVVRSITIISSCGDDVFTPASDLLRQLGNPLRKGIPAPESDVVKDFFRHEDVDTTESCAVFFTFVNRESRKRLEITSWTITTVELDARKFNAFFLRIIDLS